MELIDDWSFVKQEVFKSRSANGKSNSNGLYKVITYYSSKFNVYKIERIKVEPVYNRKRRMSSG